MSGADPLDALDAGAMLEEMLVQDDLAADAETHVEMNEVAREVGGAGLRMYPLHPNTIDERIAFIKARIHARENLAAKWEARGEKHSMDGSIALWTEWLVEALEYKQAFRSAAALLANGADEGPHTPGTPDVPKGR